MLNAVNNHLPVCSFLTGWTPWSKCPSTTVGQWQVLTFLLWPWSSFTHRESSVNLPNVVISCGIPSSSPLCSLTQASASILATTMFEIAAAFFLGVGATVTTCAQKPGSKTRKLMNIQHEWMFSSLTCSLISQAGTEQNRNLPLKAGTLLLNRGGSSSGTVPTASFLFYSDLSPISPISKLVHN